ncbi:MAG TPA: helix-turn-helix transcriptional regulator [Thermomicrobiales bacterium]|nr:helix-turn-helix transcriptional regulator [Thermomicrobiales bacterium]
MPTLGAFIRRRRTELGLTQEALADLIGDNTRQADISRLENDRVTLPRRARLDAIARALQVSPGILLAKSGWEGAEAIDGADAGPGDLAQRMTRLQDELPGAGEEVGPEHRVIAEALPGLVDTVTQMHELVHEAETLLDETQEKVNQIKAVEPAR